MAAASHVPRAGAPNVIPTGSASFDTALGGGLASGALVLVTGGAGAGAADFGWTVLRAGARAGTRRARFATALRSEERAEREYAALFQNAPPPALEFRALRPHLAALDAIAAAATMGPGDVLVLESASALVRAGGPDVAALAHALGDAAAASGGLIVLLHAAGTLPAEAEAILEESADVILHFSWRDGGPTRRRLLTLTKVRGGAPALDGDEVPVFEASVTRGVGFDVSIVRSVV